jgi:tetratricopeptide (TPR) repeat protein
LGTLVKKSLLQFSATDERYRFHPYLRRYVAEKLGENPEDEFKIREMHSAYFCTELKAHQDTHEAGQPHIASERIEMDYANIRAAWDWAVRQRNVERIDQGLDGLCHFFEWNYRFNEGITICQILNKALADVNTKSAIHISNTNFSLERVHAKVMSWEGRFNRSYDSAQAIRLLDESMEKLTKLEKVGCDVRLEMAQLLIFKADNISWSRQTADLQSSKSLLLESISLLQKTETPWLMLRCLARLSNFSSTLSSHQEARDWTEQGYLLAKKLHYQFWEVSFLNHMGWIARGQCEYDTAIKYFKNALSLADSYHIPGSMADNLTDLGNLSLFLGKLDEAAASYQKAIAIAEEKFGIQGASNSQTSLGISQWLAGDFEKAEKNILAAFHVYKNLSNTEVIYPGTCNIELFALTGRYRKAEEKIKRADEWLNNLDVIGFPFMAGRLSRVLGWVALVENRYPKAIEHIEGSIECFQYDDESIAWSQPYLALAHFGLGDQDKARKLLTEALSTSIDIQGYIPMVFTLPVTLLLLVEEDVLFAKKVYTQVRHDPFMSKAQLFHDLVYKHLPEEITSMPVEMVEHSPEHREALWETARFVLEKWKAETNGE